MRYLDGIDVDVDVGVVSLEKHRIAYPSTSLRH